MARIGLGGLKLWPNRRRSFGSVTTVHVPRIRTGYRPEKCPCAAAPSLGSCSHHLEAQRPQADPSACADESARRSITAHRTPPPHPPRLECDVGSSRARHSGSRGSPLQRRSLATLIPLALQRDRPRVVHGLTAFHELRRQLIPHQIEHRHLLPVRVAHLLTDQLLPKLASFLPVSAARASTSTDSRISRASRAIGESFEYPASYSIRIAMKQPIPRKGGPVLMSARTPLGAPGAEASVLDGAGGVDLQCGGC